MQLLHSPYIVIPPFLCNNSLNNKSIRLKSLVLTFWTAMEETTMEIRIAPKYEFQYPLNLHCSQTLLEICKDHLVFQYPLNLHCSQTKADKRTVSAVFQYPLNLHCSQTKKIAVSCFNGFNTL